MPTSTPFLAHGGVLRTAYWKCQIVTRYAHIATDALTDFILATLVNFVGQERVGDRGPCRTNQIQHASLDLTHHGVGRGKPADTHHRFIGHIFYKINVALLIAFAAKA